MRTLTVLLIGFLALLALTGCSGGDSSDLSQPESAVRPLPQVRVEMLPTFTPLPQPTEGLLEPETPTPEAAGGPIQIYIEPTPDEDFIISQIDELFAEISNKIKGQDFNYKP